MWRYTASVLLFGGLCGCVSLDTGPETGGVRPHWGKSYGPPGVPGFQGPHGEKVPMVAPYTSAPPANAQQAMAMMSQNVPLNMVQFNPAGAGPMGNRPGMPPLPVPPGGIITPPGVPSTPGGPPPGPNQTNFTGIPGQGVIQANIAPGMMPPGGVVQTAYYGPVTGARFPASRTQVRFTRPTGMRIAWFSVGPDGKPGYSTELNETPFKYNFAQGAIYRLKLSGIEGLPGLDIYPTLEVVPSNPKVDAFLAHSSVPVEFTAEDFKQVADGNYLVKVIYLPDPQFQDLVGPGIGEIISTRLEPGQDPIHEALRRGSILLVIRMGNVDQEAPNTPALSTPAPVAPPAAVPHAPAGPLLQVPYLGMPGMPGAPGARPPFPPGSATLPGVPPPPAHAAPNGSATAPTPGAPFNVPSVPLPPNGATTTPPREVAPPVTNAPAVPSAPPTLPRLSGVPPLGSESTPTVPGRLTSSPPYE